MKKVIICFMSLFVILFSGCREMVLNETDKETDGHTSEGPSESACDLWQSQCIEKEPSLEELTVNMPGLAAENQAVYHVGRGYLCRSAPSYIDYRKREYTAYVMKDLKTSHFYLLVQLYDRYITYFLGNFIDTDSQGMIACADVDGDGNDEIILNMEISPNRESLSHIYRIDNNKIKLMDDLDKWPDLHTSRYGYTYEFIGDKKTKIANEHTGDVWVKDVSGHYEFDEAGKPLYDGVYFTSYASRVLPVVGYDETVTLRYFQYVRVQGPDLLGYTVTTLQYNQEKKDFDVIKTEFIEDQYMYNWE